MVIFFAALMATGYEIPASFGKGDHPPLVANAWRRWNCWARAARGGAGVVFPVCDTEFSGSRLSIHMLQCQVRSN